MYIKKLSLHNFRCFDVLDLYFEKPINIIIGCNGSGKTSILESLHYGCYGRSFRSSSAFDMIRYAEEACSVQVSGITNEEPWNIVIGLSKNEKYIKGNGKIFSSQRDIIPFFRVITITENDLEIVTGYPAIRRHFLDTILTFLSSSYASMLRSYNQVAKQKSAILTQEAFNQAEYDAWAVQFDELSSTIQHQRIQLVKHLNEKMNVLLRTYAGIEPQGPVLHYKKNNDVNASLLKREKIVKRPLYGAHLDDLEILFNNTRARTFASRGQQKMLVILLKLASLQIINKPVLILLDDFMTDFDIIKIQQIIEALLAEKVQLIITSPTDKNILTESLSYYSTHTIKLY